MSHKQDEQQAEQLASAIENLLAEAVRATIEQRSPEPVRSCVAQLLSIEERAVPDEVSNPVQLVATLTLLGWTRLVRGDLVGDRAEDVDADEIDKALAWIEEALGKRYRMRAGHLSGVIRHEESMAESMAYRRALRDQFLPALLWLIAGAVAVHGGGDVGWLAQLERRGLSPR